MIVLEYEAKKLLKASRLPIPPHTIIHDAEEAEMATQTVGNSVVIKAQVPTGGRMKAGGILFTNSPSEAVTAADALLDNQLKGYTIDTLSIEQRLDIEHEYFIAITYDQTHRQPTIIASAQGGIDIESEKDIVTLPFAAGKSFSDFQGRAVARQLGLQGKPVVILGAIITQLATCFLEWDALLLECNPIIRDNDGQWWIADVHLDLDDDAAYRQKELRDQLPASLAWHSMTTDFERKAQAIDKADHRGVAGRLVPFGGNLGMLIGGGGASLTAMDAVLDAGLKPANYCEIGGNPSVWKIKELTKLILTQPNVDSLVVIMNVVSNTRVDLVARGVIKGVLELGMEPAAVIRAFRIPGSWEDEGFALLEHYGVSYFGRETSIDQVVAHLSQKDRT